MSGNTTTVGTKSGQGDLYIALPSVVAIAFFFAGSFFGSLLTQSERRHSHRLIFVLTAGLLAIAGVERHGALSAVQEIATLMPNLKRGL